MIDPRLLKLAQYLAKTDHATSLYDFWTGWDAIAGDLAEQAWSQDADPALCEAYTDLLASADDGVWMAPE